jgi:DNA helicase HerA-like ATPase
VRFTGEIRDKTIVLQWLILNTAGEDEIEDYRIVGTEIVADYVDERIEEQFLKIARLGEANTISPLSNQFFCRNLTGASN